MDSVQEMELLIDRIRKSPTTDEMADNCIRLMCEYADTVNIVPTYTRRGIICGCTVFEPGEKYKYRNIFNIRKTLSSTWSKSGWQCKDFYLSTSAQSGPGYVSQLDAIYEKMDNPRGLNAVNPLCFYECFNKMDALFRLCCNKVKGLHFDKSTEIDPKQTRCDNLINEMRCPECTPEYRADVCTRLIKDYGYCLSFVPVYNPSKVIKYAVKVYSNWNRKKQFVFAVCKMDYGNLAIIYSEKNFQIAENNEKSGAFSAFDGLFGLVKSKAK